MGITTKSDIALVALKANTASLALTASYFSGSITNAISASYALTASYFSGSITNATSASYALTASVALSSSVKEVTNVGLYSLIFVDNTDTTSELLTDSASLYFNPTNDTLFTTSSRAISASRADQATYSNTISVAPDTTTNTPYPIPFASTAFGNASLYSDSSVINFNPSANRLFITNISSSTITGSSFTGSFTGSLFGTASWANNVISASFASTASYFSGSISNATSASYAVTAGLAQRIEVTDLSGAAGAYEILFVDSSGSQIAYAEIGNFYYVPASDTLYVDNIIVSQSLTARGVSLTGSFSGSLVGTASWANNVISASFASTASFLNPGTYLITASWANNVISASFASTSSFLNPGTYLITASWAQSASQAISASRTITSSFASTSSFLNPGTYFVTASWAVSASQAITASYVLNAISSSFASTASFVATASWANNALTASFVNTASTNAFVQNGNSFGTTALLGTNDSQSLAFETSGSIRMFISGNGNIGIGTTSSAFTLDVSGSGRFTNGLIVTGSLIATSFTGSLQGTASWAVSSSQAVTASYVLNAVSSSFATSASFASTASFAPNYVLNSQTSSMSVATASLALRVSGSLTGSLLGTSSWATNALNAAAIDIFSFSSPVESYLLMSNVVGTTGVAVGGDTDLRYNASTNVLTVPNISATTLTGSLLGTSSWANNTTSASFASTASFLNPGTYFITASWANSASQAITASYVLNAVSSSFATSASFASTVPASGVIGLNLSQIATGSVTASVSLTQFTVTSGSLTEFRVTGTGVTLGNVITDAHTITGSLNVSGSITSSLFGTASWAISASQAITASYVLNAISASFASTSSFLTPGTYNITSSWANNVISASFASTSSFLNPGTYLVTASWANSASQAISSSRTISASVALVANTASYVLNAVSSSFASTASFVATASWANNVTSASFASTASFVNTLRQNVIISGSLTVSSSIIGSGSSYNTTIDFISSQISTNNTGSITFGTKYLVDNNNARSIRWNDRYLTDPSQSISVDWGNRTLISGSTTVLDWSSGTGSLIGTSSWATRAISASFLPVNTYNITSSWAVSASQAISASRATTSSFAISASWAPSTTSNPFPYTGSAIISGSLTITGSLQVGVPGVNNPAIDSTVGTLSRGTQTKVDWISGYLNNSSAVTSVDWESAILNDASAVGSVDWGTRWLNNTSGVTTLDWENSALYDASTFPSMDWQARFLFDSAGNRSYNYDTRTLIYPNGNTTAVDYGTQGQITLNANAIITGSLTVGSSSLGPNENTITLGARDTASEGGQIGFNAPGGTYTSASMIDLYQNRLRILKGTNAGSTAEVAWWSMQTLQMALPGYNSATAFTGSEVAMLGVDTSGNVLTTTLPGAVLTNNYVGAGFTNPIVTYMPFGATTVSGTESQRQVASPVAGTIKNFYLRTNNTAPATSYTTWTIRINGVATGITLVVSGGQAAAKYSNTINSASVAIGDDISLQVSTSVANSPQVNQYSLGIYVS